MFASVYKLLEKEKFDPAIKILSQDLEQKVDGYIEGMNVGDWIIGEEVQQNACTKIDELIAYLQYLMNE